MRAIMRWDCITSKSHSAFHPCLGVDFNAIIAPGARQPLVPGLPIWKGWLTVQFFEWDGPSWVF